MTDTVVDKSELESSAKSLNYQSWLPREGGKDHTDNTPLLHREKKGGWFRNKFSSQSQEVSRGTDASVSFLNSSEIKGPFVTRTLFGEVCL